MKFPSACGLLLLIAMVFPASAPQAQTRFGLRGGFYLDHDALFVGAQLTHPVAPRWHAVPNLELVLVERGSLFTINGDFHHRFRTRRSPYWHAGGGLGISHRSYRDFNDTDIGLNGIFGAEFGRGKTLPFAFVKLLLFAESELVIGGGVTF
ncbi:MAG: hypothetical protein ONB48_03500 [candidate division KSB1 bacterium]|nr:hypothetical protein [candidate division KSB1 bacterium]MDZ7275595.1 hypothetical protein [candidate division KSB1 bacterium]MDZ7284714.1 hypothetical protein [candidate division KSB1 bacterium]MDZ7297867.1 hypothetical protein [candidate division KSB1 bacterium]MDZ7309585.1 hypothetical protein [candidate division KSB1 bacterium]